MKILQTITDLNLSSGGAASATLNLFDELQRQEVDTTLLTLLPHHPNDLFMGSDRKGIVAFEYDGKTKFVYSRNLKKYLSENRGFDLYHANGIWTSPTHITARTALKLKKPYIITVHGMLNENALKYTPMGKRAFLYLFQKEELSKAACIHATSKYEAECIRKAGISTPVAIIPNGIKKSEIWNCKKHEESFCRFAYIGRIDPVKNIETLLEAWYKSGFVKNDRELLIIGGCSDASYLKKLHTFTNRYRLENVHFTGQISHKETERIFATIKYLILPSKSECFGMVVPEALAKGIPVIATEGTPWSELNDYRCGWWIKNDTSSLCDALVTAYSTSEKDYNEMSENGIKVVTGKYTIEECAKKMKLLYEYILGINNNKPDFII